MIDYLKIEKLFGTFNYEVTMNSEGVTILTGPNGYGKTTILKIIDAISKNNLIFFQQLKFDLIHIKVKGVRKHLKIHKVGDNIFVNKNKVVIIDEAVLRKYARKSYLTRIDENSWIDMSERKKYTSIELYNKYININIEEDSMITTAPFEEYLYNPETKLPILKNVYFIEEQRLITVKQKNPNSRYSEDSEKSLIEVIETLPNKFKNSISLISNKYSEKANSLDSSYPKRLFSTKSGLSDDEFIEEIEILKEKQEKLRKYDIFDVGNIEFPNFVKEFAKALKIYFNDYRTKYKVFDEFISMLDLFSEIINKRLQYKEVRISREFGFQVVNFKNEEIPLKHLSSGEKQEIVLIYELIFKTEQSSLVLIDEPEISLHIAWQKMFMDDLMKIVKFKNFTTFVATHSPSIINNHWDLQIDLGENNGF